MTLHRGLHVFSLKRYCVTVMDNWTLLRLFWTRDGALKWRDSIGGHAHAYHWHSNIRQWIEMSRSAALDPQAVSMDYRYTPDEIGELNAVIDELRAEVERLRAEVEEWKERWAAERRDHETTIRHFDTLMNETP